MVNGILLRELVTEVVKDTAPEELPLIAALDVFDDDTVYRRLAPSGRRDEPLGFGLEAADALVLSVVWIAVDQAVRRVVDSYHRNTSRRSWRSVFGRGRNPAPRVVPPLAPEQLRVVERSVIDACRKAGLSDKRNDQITAAVVRRLVLAPQPVDPGEAAGTAP